MWAEVYTAGPGFYPVVEGEGVGCLAILQLRVILLLDSSYITITKAIESMLLFLALIY